VSAPAVAYRRRLYLYRAELGDDRSIYDLAFDVVERRLRFEE
jgi:hypothetical protein